jgi:hypothetical protein
VDTVSFYDLAPVDDEKSAMSRLSETAFGETSASTILPRAACGTADIGELRRAI